jgi:type IV secretion system protein VirB10
VNAGSQIGASTVAGERDVRPVVALPRSGLPGLAIAGICLLLALLLFLGLNGRREAAETETVRRQSTPGVAFAPPPPLVLPAEPWQGAPPPPLRIVTTTTEPLRLRASPPPAPWVSPPVRTAPAPARAPYAEPYNEVRPIFDESPLPPPAPSYGEPALVIDSGGGVASRASGEGGGAAIARPGSNAASGPQPAPPGAADNNRRRLSTLGNPAAVMPVGTLIQAVLETPIDTFRPGLARALVSRDARGFNGQQVLVPRGSRLTGEYQADIRRGQNRVLINWTQLIRPDGSVIRLDSPSADALGAAGVAGRVDGSAVARFASGVLRTALSVGSSLASLSGRGAVVVGLPGSQLPNVMGRNGIGNGSGGRNQRIRVKQGTTFNVFVGRNLDFSDVPAAQ